MKFDPFGDFEERGYLRNTQHLKSSEAVKESEHRAFLNRLPDAVEHLRQVDQITYQDVLDTHKILFSDFYPWAGQDRTTTAPDIAVAKGGRADLFAHPFDTRAAVDYALDIAQNHHAMAATPGEVIGYLAYGHPFLDGNGRTLIVVANELAYREGISIDWDKTNKDDYLAALTRELEAPGKGALDAYLQPFIEAAVPPERSAATVADLPGLGPDPASAAAIELDEEVRAAEDAARAGAVGRRDEVGRPSQPPTASPEPMRNDEHDAAPDRVSSRPEIDRTPSEQDDRAQAREQGAAENEWDHGANFEDEHDHDGGRDR